jgi:hypothetical protein
MDEAIAVRRVDRAQRLRQQQIDDLPDQLRSRVAELSLHLTIDEDDLPLSIHDHDAARRRLDRKLGHSCRVDAATRHDGLSAYFTLLTPVSWTCSDA